MAVDPTKGVMPAWLPRVNKLVTNRIQGLWAPYLPPYAMVIHTGRKSGKTFRTPVAASVLDGKLAIPLFYGSGAQWVKNLEAAGGGEVIRAGKRRPLRNVRIVTDASAERLPPAAERALRRVAVLVGDLG